MIEILPVQGLPEIVEGDDLSAMLSERIPLADGDVVVIAQKIVSKAEGAMVAVDPTLDETAERARVVAEESVEIIAVRGDLVISRTRHGFVCAHAGVDASNVPLGVVAVLPRDPDGSAARLVEGLLTASGAHVGVIISDTFGRPWRMGQTNVALGVAGLAALRDHRGEKDAFGRTLEATVIAVADELAGAAELVMRKSDGVPAAVIRGYLDLGPSGTGADLIRPIEEDLFRG